MERPAPAFEAIPAAFGGMMAGLEQSYLSVCEALGREPDMALLAPVLAMFKRLRSEGNEEMTSHGDNRSVTARDIIGSSVVTGGHNTVSTKMLQHPLPSSGTIDVAAELAILRELLSKLNAPDRGKLDRAVQDAAEETAKPEPDKEEIAGALGRVIKYAKAADDFGQHAEKLLPRVAALGSWLGTHGQALLAMVGIAA